MAQKVARFLTDVAPSEMCKTIEAVSACENTAAGDSPPLPVLSRATFDSVTGVPAQNAFLSRLFPCLSRACLGKRWHLCKRGSEEAFFAPVTRSHAVLVSPLIAKCSVVISPATAGVTTTQRLVVVLPP